MKTATQPAPYPPTAEHTDNLEEHCPAVQLETAAEKIRLAAIALRGLAGPLAVAPGVDAGDHIRRLESRADELMRTVARLGDVLGKAGDWGLDILFQPPIDQAPPAAPLSADETIDLEPLDLLPRLAPGAILHFPAPPPVVYPAPRAQAS